MKAARIRIRIDEMALEGFSPLDGRQIADAARLELARLLAERGLPRSVERRAGAERIDAGEIRASSDAPRQLGKALAEALYKGLKG